MRYIGWLQGFSDKHGSGLAKRWMSGAPCHWCPDCWFNSCQKYSALRQGPTPVHFSLHYAHFLLDTTGGNLDQYGPRFY